MKAWQKAVLNAFFVSGINFFSVLSAEMGTQGHITWLTVIAGALSFGITFFTLMARLTDDDDPRIPTKNGEDEDEYDCGDGHNCPPPETMAAPSILQRVKKSQSNGKVFELWF